MSSDASTIFGYTIIDWYKWINEREIDRYGHKENVGNFQEGLREFFKIRYDEHSNVASARKNYENMRNTTSCYKSYRNELSISDDRSRSKRTTWWSVDVSTWNTFSDRRLTILHYSIYRVSKAILRASSIDQYRIIDCKDDPKMHFAYT